MREGFEQHVRRHNAHLRQKESLAPLPDSDDPEAWSEFVSDAKYLDELARTAGTDENTQEAILALQTKKVEVMNTLRARLAALDAGEPIDAAPNAIGVASEAGTLKSTDGHTVTPGALYTDMEWGITYAPDESVDRTTRKRFYVEEAKYELRQLLDTQILHDLIANPPARPDIRQRKAKPSFLGKAKRVRERAPSGSFFQKRLEEINSGADEQEPGHIAEKMVRTFLKRASIDFEELGFRIIEADIHQDTVHKIDFIIQRKAAQRGATVIEGAAEREEVGIQFTSSRKEELLTKKRNDISNIKQDGNNLDVDDIVLVSVSIPKIMETYEAWKRNPKPGGPATLWSEDTTRTVLRSARDHPKRAG